MAIDDPKEGPGGTYHDLQTGDPYIGINLGLIRQIRDQIFANTGYRLDLDSPFVIAFLAYVAIHEIAHSNCCHTDSGSTIANNCREVLADINGANATCAFVEALVAGLNGDPPSEFMAAFLHLLCQHIQEERDKYNTAEGRSQAAGCKGWSDGERAEGRAGGCECTATSWDPPKPDPCIDCPDFPHPGSDPAHPYGDGDVIPSCDICDHI